MLETAIDIAMALLIARLFASWVIWLTLSAAAGALGAAVFALGSAALDLVPAGLALTRGLPVILTHSLFCALCAWVFSRWPGPIPSEP